MKKKTKKHIILSISLLVWTGAVIVPAYFWGFHNERKLCTAALPAMYQQGVDDHKKLVEAYLQSEDAKQLFVNNWNSGYNTAKKEDGDGVQWMLNTCAIAKAYNTHCYDVIMSAWRKK